MTPLLNLRQYQRQIAMAEEKTSALRAACDLDEKLMAEATRECLTRLGVVRDYPCNDCIRRVLARRRNP